MGSRLHPRLERRRVFHLSNEQGRHLTWNTTSASYQHLSPCMGSVRGLGEDDWRSGMYYDLRNVALHVNTAMNSSEQLLESRHAHAVKTAGSKKRLKFDSTT